MNIIKDKVIEKTFINKCDFGDRVFEKITTKQHNTYSNVNVIEDIVKAIRFSDSIFLVLKNKCLSRIIVEELNWIKDQINITAITNSKDISYSFIKNTKINEKVNFNAMITINKDKVVTYFIDEISNDNDEIFYIKSENTSIYESLFNKKQTTDSFSLIKNANYIHLFGNPFEKINDDIIDYCELNNKKLSIYIGTKDYNKNLYDKFIELKSNLYLTTNKNFNIMFFETKTGFYKGIYFNETYHYYEINKIYFDYAISGEHYKLSKLPIECSLGDLKNKYVLNKEKKIIPLIIKDEVVIENTIELDDFNNYENEKFDNSFYKKHIDYFDYKAVHYITTLVPPLLNKEYKLCDKYTTLTKLTNDFLKRYSTDYTTNEQSIDFILTKSSNGFISSINQLIKNTLNELDKKQGTQIDMIKLYQLCDELEKQYSVFDIKIVEECPNLFEIDANSDYDEKTQRILDEISEKEQLQNEFKEKLFDENENHTRIKRRIDDIEEDIETLKRLLVKQQSNLDTLKVEDKQSYINRLKKFLSNEAQNNNIEHNSLSRVIGKDNKLSESAKIEKNVYIVINHYKTALQYFIKLYKDIKQLDLPLIGDLYLGKNNDAIAIKYEQEVELAKKEIVKFNAKLLIERK